MSRIDLDMKPIEAAILMAEGNPGAAVVLGQLLKSPSGLLEILKLDDMEIYGSNIWICYKDICNQDIEKLREKIHDGSIKEELEPIKE